jgi:hypothetical protein
MLHVVSQYGWMGVELFFLISGFVICMSSWGRGVGTYFASRVSRLFPAYLFAAMLTASVVAVWPGFSLNTNNENILLNFTMVEVPLGGRPIDSVYWTLLAELLFYLLFALVVWRGLTYQRAVAFCVLWTMASIVVPMFAGKFAGVVFQPEYSPYFIAGIAFYLMYRFGPNLLLCCIVGVSYILATHQIQTDVQAQATVAGNYLNETVVDARPAVLDTRQVDGRARHGHLPAVPDPPGHRLHRDQPPRPPPQPLRSAHRPHPGDDRSRVADLPDHREEHRSEGPARPDELAARSRRPSVRAGRLSARP